MKPAVAIVIVTWNRKDVLLECLTSLEKLTTPGFSVIVVDNGSSDGTAEAAARRFPEAEVLTSSGNRGFAGGNNLGIKRALEMGTDYVCLLNNDTVVDPDFLDELLHAAGRHPRAGILGARVTYFDRPGVIWSQGITVNRLTGRIRAPGHNRGEADLPGTVAPADSVSGAAMLLSAEMLREVGVFNEDYFLCFEDIDLCLRARQKGYHILTVPTSLVRHRVSASMGGEHSETVVYYAARNHLLVINRRFPVSALFRGTRNFLITLFTFLFAAVTSGVPRGSKIRAWQRGTVDYYRGRFGERTG